MTQEDYLNYHRAFCNDMMAVVERKNHDYAGGGNDAFKNFRQIESLIGSTDLDVVAVGFLTRMSDKFSRLGSFINQGKLMVKEESVEDTLMDLANYSILFAGYLKGMADQQRKAQGDNSIVTKDQG